MRRIAIKDILELMGIAGVIISLIFVGLEIRQNSAVAQAESIRAANDGIRDIALSLSDSPELAQLVIDVNLGYVSPNELDRQQSSVLYFYNFAMLTNWSASFTAAQAGVIPIEEFEEFDGTYLINPYVVTRWNAFRPSLDRRFVEYVESLNLFE